MVRRLALAWFSLVVHALSAGEALRTREILPWNLIENGGFEQDATGLFAVGQAQRDRENPASGDACARFEIPAGKTTLQVRISNGLRLERGRDYILAGRMRTALKSPMAEAAVLATLLGVRGEAVRQIQAIFLPGNNDWRPFIQRIRGDGTSPLQLSLAINGEAGERVWLDDLFIGPSEVELSWDAPPGSGLLQGAVADGAQFEFPIPPHAHVLGVFRNGRRLRELTECQTLYGARVIRLFETPARGEHIAVVLRSVSERAQMPVSPLYRYGLYSKAGRVDTWIPAGIKDFKAPGVDYAALEREAIELPSIEGLPTEFAPDSPREIALKVHAPGRYSLRLRGPDGRTHSLAEYRAVEEDGVLMVPFNGCDETGAPLPPGEYVWDVLHRPLNAFARKDTVQLDVNVRSLWRSGADWMLLMSETLLEGKPVRFVMRADATFKAVDRKAVIPGGDLENVVEGAPGEYYFMDGAGKSIHRLKDGAVSVVLETGEKPDSRRSLSLAAHVDGGESTLFVAAKDLCKIDGAGKPVAAFGVEGRVSETSRYADAILPLEDGGVLALAHGVLRRLDAAGKALPVWRGRGEVPLSDELTLAPREKDLAPLLGTSAAWWPRQNRRNPPSYIQRAPSGEILVALNGEEIQVYSAGGEYLATIGAGPQVTEAVRDPDYFRCWDERGSQPFSAIASLSFDSNGDLIVFDGGPRVVTRWAFTPRVSNALVKIKAGIVARAPQPRAFDPLPAEYALDALKKAHGVTARVIDFKDLASPMGVRDDGTSSVLRRPPLQPYRLSGSEHCSWFSTELRVQTLGNPHLLLVEYPNDARRRTMLWLPGQQAGYSSGGAHETSGKERYFTTLLFPAEERLNVVFTSFLGGVLPQTPGIHDGTPYPGLLGAAASRVWLLEVENFTANPIEEPLAGEKRSLGELQTVGDSLASDRIALDAWVGVNRLYGTKPAREYAPDKPEFKTEFSTVLLDLKGVPAELKDFQMVSEFGRSVEGHLSLVYPEVQAHFMKRILDAAREGKDIPQFGSVTLRLDRRAAPLFGSHEPFEVGYEALTVKTFEEATAQVVPGQTLADKVAVLKTGLRDAWTRWRCEVVAKWIYSVRDKLKELRPDLTLCIYGDPAARPEGFDPALYINQPNIRLLEVSPRVPLHDLKENGLRTLVALKPEALRDGVVLRHGPEGHRVEWHEESSDALVPSKEHIQAPLIAALIRDNPREIVLQSRNNPYAGFELELREFARAFRSLPYAPVDELAGAAMALKVYRFGPKARGEPQYLAIVNPTTATLTRDVRVAHDAAKIRNLMEAADVTARVDGENLVFEITVPPKSIRTVRIGP